MARQALRPGCEELAGRIRSKCRRRKRGTGAQNRHGGAPRGGRPSHKGRKAPHKRLACSVEHAHRVPAKAPGTSLGAPPTPHSGERSQKVKTRAQKTRRGNEGV